MLLKNDLPFVLDFRPSTNEDAQKMENGSYPAYEINMTPMIYLGNDAVNGSNVILGTDLNVTLTLELVDTINTTKKSYAVEKTAIVIDAPKTEFLAYNRTFERVRALQDAGGNETLAREGLYLIGSNFFLSSDFYTDGLSDSFGLRWSRVKPSVVFVTKENKVDSFEGIPISVTNGGTSIDLKFDQVITSSSINETVAFNLQRGLIVSGFEGTVLELFYNITSISATKILNKAIAENVPIYFISNDTIDRLNYLLIPKGDKEIIRSLLKQSPNYFTMVPANTFQIGNWRGIGYVIIDAETGAGKYLIRGGLAGGETDDLTELIKDMGKDVVCVVFTIIENISYIITGLAALCIVIGIKVPHPYVRAFCAVVYTAVTTKFLEHPLDIPIEKFAKDQKEALKCG